MQPQDAKIVETIIDRALAKGYAISVAFGLRRSMDKTAILDDLEASDEDCLSIMNGDKLVGHIHLVHGNEDGVVVADYSAKPEIEALIPDDEEL